MKKRYVLAIGLLVALGLTACDSTGSGVTTGSINTKEQAAGSKVDDTKETTEEYAATEYGAIQSYLEFSGDTELSNNEDAKVIKIAYGYSGYPIAYTTKDGGASGYDIEVLKAVDALLPEYQFEFVPSQGGDDLLLGVQTGKFNGAVRNWFKTEEREQIFTFPKKNLGLSVTGLTVRTADIDRIYDFATVSEAGGLLAPVDPGDGHYTVLKKWNDANPDKAWDFETGSIASVTDAYAWVAEGRYDAYFGLEVMFNRNVVSEDGPAHKYAEVLSWTPCAAIPTYVIFSKEEQALADAFDQVIDKIWDSGYPSFIQETVYGTDYIGTYGRDGVGFGKN